MTGNRCRRVHESSLHGILSLGLVLILASGCGGPCGTTVEAKTVQADYLSVLRDQDPPPGVAKAFVRPSSASGYHPYNLTVNGLDYHDAHLARLKQTQAVSGRTATVVEVRIAGYSAIIDVMLDWDTPDPRAEYRSILMRFSTLEGQDLESASQVMNETARDAGGVFSTSIRDVPVRRMPELGVERLTPSEPACEGRPIIDHRVAYRNETMELDFDVPYYEWSSGAFKLTVAADQRGCASVESSFQEGTSEKEALRKTKELLLSWGLPPLAVSDEAWQGSSWCS
jgi:hypothetical protein